MIYRDFNHWYSQSHTHGCSSASRDWLEEIWNDIYPTIEANLDDHKKAYIELSREKAKSTSELTDALLDYIETFKTNEMPQFWRWWFDQSCKEHK